VTFPHAERAGGAIAQPYADMRALGETAPASRFNRTIHGARGLFAGAVFVFHVVNSGLASFALLATPAAAFVLGTTEYGVELFFCISGFVIAGTLRRAAGPGSFLADRAIRIVPTLWATLVVIIAFGELSHSHGFADLSRSALATALIANFLMLPGLLPFPEFHPAAWSLSYEAAFYILCALGWVLALRGGRRATWLVAPFAVVAITLFPRAIFFVTGLLTAQLLARSPRLAALRRAPAPWLVAFVLLWHEVRVLTPSDRVVDATLLDWLHDWRLPIAIAAVLAATIGFAGLAAEQGLLARLMRTRLFQYLGTISYSFYLWHLVVMAFVKHAMLRYGIAEAAGPAAQLVFGVGALIPTIAVAHVSERFLERGTAVRLRALLHHRPPLATPAALPPAAE
jgi:peptidoglycan/LPS O-acetylase OafA/YrhL